MKKIVFRSAIYNSNEDPNTNIEYLGIFKTIDIISTPTQNLTLSSAYIALSNVSRNVFLPNSAGGLIQNGFDANGGTYYEFAKDESFEAVTSCNLLGYTQLPNTMSDQPESMYCAIGFSVYGYPVSMKLLSGSAIPYPYYNNPFVSTAYLDGTRSYNAGTGVIFPSTIGPLKYSYVTDCNAFGPSSGGSPSQSQYALSQPIGTSVLGIRQGQSISQVQDYFFPWTTTLTPTNVFAGVQNFVMLQDTNFSVYQYDDEEVPRVFGNPLYTITGDEVFPSEEETALVGVANNITSYYFIL